MKKLIPAFSSLSAALLTGLILSGGGLAQGQSLIYQQNFDAPTNANGDIYFTTSPVYNGITDATSSHGIFTGGSFAGSPAIGDGIIDTSFDAILPQSGAYLLANQTNVVGATTYNGTFFSTAGTTINLLPGSVYRLSFYSGSGNNTNEPLIQATINGVAQGAAFNPTVGALTQTTYTYNAGAATTAVIAFNNNTATGAGNDLAFDSVSFNIIRADFPTMGLTPNQTAIANNLSSGNLNRVSTPVFNALVASPGGFPGDLDQLSPEQFNRFTSITAFNNASFETQAMDDYLATERNGPHGTFAGGNGGIDSSALTVNDPSYDPSLAMIHSRMLAWNPGPAEGVMSDVPSLAIGGVDMKDAKDMKSMAPAYTDPWNFFVRGNVILGQGLSQTDVAHFDENTESVVLGTDYRINPNFLVGLTAGYGHTDVTLDTANSSATVDSYSPGLYASYANDGWYANAVGDYVHNAYTEDRVISFLGQTAHGAPEGNEGVADLDGGYDFHRGALTFGPVAGLQYTHLTVDGFDESGSVADLTVHDDQSDSLRSRLGGRISYAWTCHGMSMTPHLSATWQHEFMDQSRGITSQFDGVGLGSFDVRTENPERDFALADAGVTADLNRTASVFADYLVQAGQSNYFGQSVQAGVKIGF